jgi:hypothetical protein
MIFIKTGIFSSFELNTSRRQCYLLRGDCVWMKLLIKVRDTVGSSNKITWRWWAAYQGRMLELDRKLTCYKLPLIFGVISLTCTSDVRRQNCNLECVFFNPVSAKCRFFRTFTLLYSYLKVSDSMQILTAVFMKSPTFLVLTPCSLLKVNQSFGRTYRLHLQGWKISQARKQK